MSSNQKYSIILKWIKLINKRPNNDCEFFYLSDSGSEMIIDLFMMKNLTLTLKQLLSKDRAYVFINIYKKSVRYYAFKLNNETLDSFDEVDNYISYKSIEDSLYLFLEENALKISKWNISFSQMLTKENNLLPKSLPLNKCVINNYDENYNKPYYQNNYKVEHNSNLSNYKDRELFQDTIFSLIKDGRTGNVIDCISDFINLKAKENLELINSVFNFNFIQKLDLFSIKHLLFSTANLDQEKIPDRKYLVSRYKTLILTVNENKRENMLKDIILMDN